MSVKQAKKVRLDNSLVQKTKRGDTIIEVMFAFAIFTMIAIVSVMVMNSGIAASERSLELVTAREELNAQAEALRFIHSSYISEMSLRACDDVNLVAGEKCQQYEKIWQQLTTGARVSAAYETDPNHYSIPSEIKECSEIYDSEAGKDSLLVQNHAFVINTRELLSNTSASVEKTVVHANNANANPDSASSIFVEPLLGARILYGLNSTFSSDNNSSTHMSDSYLSKYTKIVRAEGIWIVAVAGPTSGGSKPSYYDFYIDTCWYGSGAKAPTTLDAVVRLYNPVEK